MSEPSRPESATDPDWLEAAGDELSYGVAPELVHAVADFLDEGRRPEVAALVGALHAADVADLLQELDPDRRAALIEATRDELDPETLTHLDETVRDDVIELLSAAEVAAAVTELESDDALEVIEDLDDAERVDVLARLSAADRAIIEEALSYPEDSAGRLMQREIVTVPQHWSVGDTIDYMRARAALLPRDFYDIFVVDDARVPVGVVPLSRLMRNRRPIAVADILHPDLKPIPVEADQEEVALLFQQYGLVSAPVVDDAGRLVGVITVDDVVDVIQDEAEEDMMRMAGVREDDFYSAVLETTRLRVPWLTLTMGTGFAAAFVISLFEATIEQIVVLAVLMPIVALLGGNAGTQALAVAVRALAMKELTPANSWRTIVKEALVGCVNGLIFAVLLALAAWAWTGQPMIGVVIAMAVVVTMLFGGLAGVTLPILLDRLKIDPAVASSGLLTTLTDVVGFLAFLGLATLILL